ncbi:MAG: sugar ABC transporter substrate-binding protein [Xenococcaceae cyanobacterium]
MQISLNNYRRQLKFTYWLIALSIVFIAVACNYKQTLPSLERATTNNVELTIWWDKGFNLEEDEALKLFASKWSSQTGNKVKLIFYPTNELLEKIQRSLKAGNPPDLVMANSSELSLLPRLAWEGKLANVSDVIDQNKNLYPKSVLDAINFYNDRTKKSSYYGVPIAQVSIHIFYWQKLIQKIGHSNRDIPGEWDEFWHFWQKAQQDSQLQQQKKIYGLGLPLSIASPDTYYLFEQILEAYDVTILDANGILLVDRPQIRQGIIKCLDWYAQFYHGGYIPPEAIDWLNMDNNRSLLNRIAMMTPNVSLSIPAAVRQDPDTYYHKMGILELPKKPNGKPMRHLVSVRQAAIFSDSTHQSVAKDFLRYLIEPENMKNYLKANGIRNLPTQKLVLQDSFWKYSKDPYTSVAIKTITKGQTRLFYTVRHPAYSIILKENIWGKALQRIVVDRYSSEKAADEAIERIKTIFKQWDEKEASS